MIPGCTPGTDVRVIPDAVPNNAGSRLPNRKPKAHSSHERQIVIGLNAVVVGVMGDDPHVLTVDHSDTGEDALPFGPFDPGDHRTLEVGLRTWVREQTHLSLGYVEQLYTFGDRYRDLSEKAGGPRIISVGYLALVQVSEGDDAGEVHWQDCYRYLP